jgi:PAS domain S-box-containing protein
MPDQVSQGTAFMQAVLESARDAILICNAEGIVTNWNDAAAELLGYSAQEIVGQPVTTLTPANRLDEERPMLDQIARGEAISDCQTQRLQKDGQVIDVYLSVTPVLDETTTNLLGAIHVLRSYSKGSQLDPQMLLAAIFESADDAIITKDLHGVITSWNPGAKRMFGYEAAEMIGKPISNLIPSDQPDEEANILRRIRSGKPVDHYETKRQTKDGRIVDISLTVSPIRDSKGNVVGASKIARDITEKKRIEVREREAKQRAEALSRAKDEFIATVSHELRTPMTAILGWVRMLASGQLKLDAQKKGFEVIERNARSQAQLIEDLLDMSRIISGKLKLTMTRLDLSTLIAAVVESHRPTAEMKSIRVRTAIDPAVKYVVADEERFRQVLWNLLSNALKFTPSGGHVQVSLDRAESFARISVADDGIGIKPEFLPYVFDRFSQADSSITRFHGGLGMGLSIVKSIVELHGGEVSVSSSGEGKGATFSVMLPLVTTTPRREEEFASTEALLDEPLMYSRDLVGLKLLVVDDEPDTCEMLSFLLEGCGAEVRTANTATEALEQLKSWSPNVLICDIGMPAIDGYELIRRIRSDETLGNAHIPAVALTALARIEDRVKALSAGYQMHVAKPIEPVELVSMIASVATLGYKRPS